MGLKTARKRTTAHGQCGARSLLRPFALFSLRRTGQAFERALHLALQLAMGWLTTLAPAHAAPFIIVNGQTATTTQVVGAGETGTVEAGGTISTAVADTYGVDSSGDNATINNGGSINTTGERAFAINSSGFAALIRNSGSIVTKGVDAIGIYTDNHQATIINSGRISTTGNGGVGIEIFELDSVVTNSGKVSTTGIAAHGIVADSAKESLNKSVS